MKKFGLTLIKIYQFAKPIRTQFTRTLFGSERTCRFYPTCSDYTSQAIKKHGLARGFIMGFWRLLRCNPFGGHGFDPVK